MDWMRRLAGAAGAILIGWLGAGAADAAPALWRVSDADSQIYLFGTLHVLSPKAKWRTPLYDQVLADAGTVWFEADMQSSDPETLRLLFQRYGSDGCPAQPQAAGGRRAALARQTDLARIEPAALGGGADAVGAPAPGPRVSVAAGADMVATRAARDRAKTIRTFETLEDRARMYAGLRRPRIRYLTDVVRSAHAAGSCCPPARRRWSRPGSPVISPAWAPAP